MISDVLADAGQQIDRYLAAFPEAYQVDDTLLEEIKDVQIRMALLRAKLDRPPAPVAKAESRPKNDAKYDILMSSKAT